MTYDGTSCVNTRAEPRRALLADARNGKVRKIRKQRFVMMLNLAHINAQKYVAGFVPEPHSCMRKDSTTLFYVTETDRSSADSDGLTSCLMLEADGWAKDLPRVSRPLATFALSRLCSATMYLASSVPTERA